MRVQVDWIRFSESHPLPHKLHSPGDLSKGEAFVTIVKNAVRISDADVEAWHSARTRTGKCEARYLPTSPLYPRSRSSSW